MNKKNLSVVMAGAMLATSVAPVLADSTTSKEYTESQKATLIKEIQDKMETKMVSTNTGLLRDDSPYLTKEVLSKTKAAKGESAYGVRVLNKAGEEVALSTFGIYGDTTVTYKKDDVAKIINHEKFLVGYTIELVERANNIFKGQVILGSLPTAADVALKFKVEDFSGEGFKAIEKNFKLSKIVSDVTTKDGVISVTTKKQDDILDSSTVKVLKYTINDDRVDTLMPLDKDGNLIELKDTEENYQKFDSFMPLVTSWSKSTVLIAKDAVVDSFKVVADPSDGVNVTYLASDLYDGFALTAKGTELADMKANEKYDTIVGAVEGPTSGVYTFKVTIKYKDKDVKVVTVKSTNKKEIDSLRALLYDGSYNVGIIGGDNRYETAVNVDRAMKRSNVASADPGVSNIVLVNGESLVDGLSAAPLAATLDWKGNQYVDAPLLLTEKDSLPKATKDYIDELTSDISKKDKKDKVKIHLVGGEAVLSENLVSELKDMGYTVVRYGGDNREETSLKVAKAMNKTSYFVVGGNGEADAMSIGPVASKKYSETPIIVSSVHGLSKDAIEQITNTNTTAVTIIGGESSVSAAEMKKIDEALESVLPERVAGKDRFETNAAIINKYYTGNEKTIAASNVVLVKDGITNKFELVDALSAANYAAKAEHPAPIVLASKSLKDVQKNELLKTGIRNTGKVTQIGIGAERTVLETIAGLFGISNK